MTPWLPRAASALEVVGDASLLLALLALALWPAVALSDWLCRREDEKERES